MVILFQNKIIYMPSMSPSSRGEKIEHYQAPCRLMVWRQNRIRGRDEDGVEVALAVGEVPVGWNMG